MPDTALPPALTPIVDDKTATHATIKSPDSESQNCSTVCDLDVAGSLSLPGYAGWRTIDDYAGAIAAGVTCLICLGWLGARHAHPPVVVKGSWFPYNPPDLPGETSAAYTDRLTGYAAHKLGVPFEEFLTAQTDPYATCPYDHRRNRQCSINYHDECSDPRGESCECPCHRQGSQAHGAIVELFTDDEPFTDDGEALGEPPTPGYDAGEAMRVFGDIAVELRKAIGKFPGQHLPLGFGPDVVWWPVVLLRHPGSTAADVRDVLRAMTDASAEGGTLTWRHVIAEEFAEAAAEDDRANARAELVQQAAMCVRAILDIDDPQPVSFTGPSGVRWVQTGTGSDGTPIVAAQVNDVLTSSGSTAPTSGNTPGGSDA